MRSRTPLCYRGILATVKSFMPWGTKICHFYPSSRHSQPSRSDPTHWTRLRKLQFLVLSRSGISFVIQASQVQNQRYQAPYREKPHEIFSQSDFGSHSSDGSLDRFLSRPNIQKWPQRSRSGYRKTNRIAYRSTRCPYLCRAIRSPGAIGKLRHQGS